MAYPDKPEVRLLVCGGRAYSDRDRVFHALTKLSLDRYIVLMIHGGATGADALADEWAISRTVPRMVFPISPYEWQMIGRSAGPKRNALMLKEGRPTAVVAFPGGSGTDGMCRLAQEAGVPVWRPFG